MNPGKKIQSLESVVMVLKLFEQLQILAVNEDFILNHVLDLRHIEQLAFVFLLVFFELTISLFR